MRTYYQVAPRYTPGSPGMVDQTTAERVAREEKEAYMRTLEGIYGDEETHRAQAMGLRGISERKTEKGSGKSHRYEIHDLCTGEVYDMPMGEQLQKLGFRHYRDLGEHVRKLIDANPPRDLGDWHRAGWFKINRFDDFEVYRPTVRAPTSTGD